MAYQLDLKWVAHNTLIDQQFNGNGNISTRLQLVKPVLIIYNKEEKANSHCMTV